MTDEERRQRTRYFVWGREVPPPEVVIARTADAYVYRVTYWLPTLTPAPQEKVAALGGEG